MYTVIVKKRLMSRKYKVKGHSLTASVVIREPMTLKDGKTVLVAKELTHGPVRLELFLPDGSVKIFPDVTKIQFDLGTDWFAIQQQQVQNDSGGAASTAVPQASKK